MDVACGHEAPLHYRYITVTLPRYITDTGRTPGGRGVRPCSTVTLPLHYRYRTRTWWTWRAAKKRRYITVTLPLQDAHLVDVACGHEAPLHYRYITVTLPLHYRYRVRTW